MKTLTVPEDFVISAYKAACPDWKLKLEEQFPDVFRKGMIGKMLYPRDNSYCFDPTTRKATSGPAGNAYQESSPVLIISEPFKSYVNGVGDKEFVTVLFNGNAICVLNRFSEEPIKREPAYWGLGCTAAFGV